MYPDDTHPPNMNAIMKKLLLRFLISVASLSIVVIVLITVTSQGRAVVRTALFIPQVLPDFPIKPQEWITSNPLHQEVYYPIADGQGVADLYLPAGDGNHSAVLFFQGVVPGGRYDPRIVNLANGLARSGMIVMIPWSDTQTENRIITSDIDNLVYGFQFLRQHESTNPEKVGMGGICVGASLSVVAAQDKRIRDHVRFVNFFAGYYDATDFVRAIGSKSRYYNNYVVPWDTDKLTYQIFRNHLIDGLTNEADKKLLNRIFKDYEQVSESEMGSLTIEGTAVYGLLTGVPFDEVDVLIDQLSPKTKAFLHTISPSTNIDQLKARILIMHDSADRLVPSEESRRLVDGLGKDSDTYYTEFSSFQKQIQVHMAESESVSPVDYAREVLKLFMHMYNIMNEV